MTEAYPLAWPTHRPRRRAAERVRGEFSETVAGTTKARPVSISTAFDRLERQVELLGGIYFLLSTNLELRKDGVPRRDRGNPADPGACVYFQMKGRPYALACDTYTDVAQNIAALANHIDTLRRQERYGVATAAESLQAFTALAAPKSCWEILGLTSAASDADVKAAWRKRIGDVHPDQGGTHDATAELNAARDEALRRIGARP